MGICRSSNKKVPRLYRSTANPLGPGHSWVKGRFIDFWLPLASYEDSEEDSRNRGVMYLGGKTKVRRGPAGTSIYDSDMSIARDMSAIGVKWHRANKAPGSRRQGLEQNRQLFSNALKEPIEAPGLFVRNTCEHFLRTVPPIPRDPVNVEDTETKAEDHAYDALRYRILARRSKATINEI